jgi:hypothetical protein
MSDRSRSTPKPATPPGLVPRGDLETSIRTWLSSDNNEQYFVISGAMGSGKTTTLASLLDEGIDADRVAVAHFCDPNNLETRNPIAAAESLAAQLASAIEPFAQLLAASSADAPLSIVGRASAEQVEGTLAGVFIRKLTINASAEEAWRRLVLNPLRLLEESNAKQPVLIVLDALDEADRFDGPVRLSDLVASIPPPSPSVRFLLSTRTPDRLFEALGDARAVRWDLSSGEGLEESRLIIGEFLEVALRRLRADGKVEAGRDVRELASEAAVRSENNFLYARFLIDTIALGTRPISIEDIARLPPKIEQFWRKTLRQIVGTDEGGWLDRFEPLLAVLCAAREPLYEPELEAFTGLSLGPLRLALARMRPFLDRSRGDGTSPRSHSFYHTGVRDFLTDPGQAREWHCDERRAHRRIVNAFRKWTDGWQEDRWRRVAGYGLRHLITHAQAGDEAALTLDAIATPGFFEAVNRQDGFASVDQHLRALQHGAVASADGIRALRWVWTRHQLQDHLTEQLIHGAGPILIRAGRAAAAWASLATMDSTHWKAQVARERLVAAFARDRQTQIAEAIAAEAEPEGQQQQLRLLLAAELAQTDPGRAVELVRPGPFTDDVLARLCAELATHPTHVDDAWAIAQPSAAAQHAVVASVAQHAPEVAATLARSVATWQDAANGFVHTRGPSSALGDVCVAAAASDRSLVARLIPELDQDGCARAAFALALHGGAKVDEATEAARDGISSDALLLLVDAARVVGSTDYSAPAQAPATELEDHFLGDIHKYDVDVIARIDLERLRDNPLASGYAAAALRHVVDGVMEHSYIDNEPTEAFEKNTGRAGGFAALAGALALFDLEAAIDLARRGASLDIFDKPSESDTFEGVITRLTPVDPHAAWALTHSSHPLLLAWGNALPKDAWDWAAERIGGIAQSASTTRVALLGTLAAKIEREDTTRNELLFGMLPTAAESANFTTEREQFAAALRRAMAISGQERDLPECPDEPWYRDAKDMALEAEAALRLRRGEDLQVELDALQSSEVRVKALGRLAVATGTDVAVYLHAAANELAGATKVLPVAVLAETVGALAANSSTEAQKLANEIDDRRYSPPSVHQPVWLSLEPSVGRAYMAWRCADLPADALADRFLELTARREDSRLAVVIDVLITSLTPAERGSLDKWVLAADQTVRNQLKLFAAVSAGDLERAEIDDRVSNLDALATAHLLRRYAPVNPETAVRMCTEFARLDRTPTMMHGVLAAVAQRDPALARALHREVDWPADSAIRDDALHAIARATAPGDWDAALAILQDIEYENVIGLALYDLAAIAGAAVAADERSEKLVSVLIRGDDLGEYPREKTAEGVLAAMSHAAVDTAVLSQVIAFVARGPDLYKYLGDLTALLASAYEPSQIPAEMSRVERLLYGFG